MIFYRRMAPIKAISFDLDDTLYDNAPVIVKAEQAQLRFLQQQVNAAKATNFEYWIAARHQVADAQPSLNQDISRWRQQSIFHGLRQLGVPDHEAEPMSHDAFQHFLRYRNHITLSPAVWQLLERLAQRYRLIALTNGNAQISAFGLDRLFDFAMMAGQDGLKQKPSCDLFRAACQQLKLPTANLLHIGDSVESDVQGALNAGCSALWFNPKAMTLDKRFRLPHGQIQQLSALDSLLG